MAGQSKKKKVRFIQGPQFGGGIAVAVPSSNRQARRGTASKPHRIAKRRSR